MDRRGEHASVRLAVVSGDGRIARRENCLLFVPARDDVSEHDLTALFDGFIDDGATEAVRATRFPRCIIEWGDVDDPIAVDTTIQVQQVGAAPGAATDRSTRRINSGRHDIDREILADFSLLAGTDAGAGHGGRGRPGDLRDGDVPAGGFDLAFVPARQDLPETAAVTAESQFEELADLDVTLTAIGPITYPDDDTDRTIRRPGDVRCPRGHANSSSNVTCRVCGDALDSTAGRPGPRASTALAGLRLPDETVIPINRMIVVGRSPSPQGARLQVTPRLVAIDAPGTVSRTHVLFRVDGDTITVTDCGARGRTAVLPFGQRTPVALEPWQPRIVAIGDTIQLGGPTTLTITEPAELRIPPAFEPTAPPPERNETR